MQNLPSRLLWAVLSLVFTWSVPTVGTAATVSGTVSCAGCFGPVGVVALPVGGGTPLAQVFVVPGAYSLALPSAVAQVEIFAYSDGDLDGEPDPPLGLVGHEKNPVDLGGGDVSGIDIELTWPTAPGVTVSGEVSCPLCPGLVGLLLLDGPLDAGALLAKSGPAAPGPFAMTVAAEQGEAWLFAFADTDIDGVPDAGLEPVGAGGNPLTIAASDIDAGTIELALPAVEVVKLSGTISCDGCPAVGIVLSAVGGGPLTVLGPVPPGPWSTVVPASLGPVELAAFVDLDVDGDPDEPDEFVSYPENPIEIGKTDITGLDINLGDAEGPDVVKVSGAVSCDGGCVGPLWLLAASEPGPSGIELASVVLGGEGDFELALSPSVGTVYLYAARDYDLDGEPDGEWSACTENPVDLGSGDVVGLSIELESVTVETVTISGEVLCPDCVVLVRLLFFGPDGLVAPPIWSALVAPGPFSVSLPVAWGPVHAFAFRDADLDGEPDGGKLVEYEGNPIATEKDVDGVVIDLGTASTPELVTISGEIICPGCGLVGVEVTSADGGLPLTGPLLLMPGPYSVKLPKASGPVNVFGFSDFDADGAPDPPLGLVAAEKNPVPTAGGDVSGVDVLIGIEAPKVVKLSGEVLCSTCVTVGVLLLAGDTYPGPPMTVLGPMPKGKYTLTVPADFGPVSLAAFRDMDADGAPDDEPVAYELNPVGVGSKDLFGLDIDLDAPPLPVDEGVEPPVVVEEGPDEGPVVEAPPVEEPTVVEPMVEEPPVAEPTVEEPPLAEPTVEEPPIAEEPTPTEPSPEPPLPVETTVEPPSATEDHTAEPAPPELDGPDPTQPAADAPGDDGGCGCRTSSKGSSPTSGPTLFVLIALLYFVRLRRC